MLKNAIKILTSIGVASCAVQALAADNGSQMSEPFRINYAGYMPQAYKLGLYLNTYQGPINWQLAGTSCTGTSDDYVSNDKSSGDSFYRIDFSACTDTGSNLRLQVGTQQSQPFVIADDPYGAMKYEFFDYFKDHEGSATFSNAKNNWQTGLSISFQYVKDAGDNGAYPVNTAEAAWSLINLLETYPAVNNYYAANLTGARSVYEQLVILTEQFDHVFAHGGPLAIPKFHTNVNSSWAACSPHTSGTCISEPETKATFSAARTLAAMARLHDDYAGSSTALDAYARAKTALSNAQTTPLTCNQADSFGGEGGMYPDNDNYSIYRDPKSFRDNCAPSSDNTQDDEYAALVEVYLAALKLGQAADAANFKSQVTAHPRFNEVSSFWWGAVTGEGNLSLLTNEALHDIDLTNLKANVLVKADSIIANQQLGYPGVTWDPNSEQWNNGDQEDADNNVRWGSHRNALNDARIVMAASQIASSAAARAHYARQAITVLDHIAGLNAMALTMFTTSGYTGYEHAVTRTHDGADGRDQWPGKMVLGPNNWTNADDGAMPAFNSQPGLKMFAVTGTGWASREISIDANAALVPVAYFATEVAPALLAAAPLGNTAAPINAPAPATGLVASVNGTDIALSWQDNAGNNDDAEQGYRIYASTSSTQPATAMLELPANRQQAMLTGLLPGATYNIWVEAFNSLGSSPAVTASATTEAAPAVENLITNGDFSNGTTAWRCSLPAGSATCTVVAGEYVVAISNGGSASWHIQPTQGGLSLQSGKTYTFAFDAKAAANRNAEIKVERNVSPWEDFSQTGSGQALTTSMQRFVYTFTMPTSLTTARMVLNIGNSNSDVTIDNVWLVEGNGDPCGGQVGCANPPDEPETYTINVTQSLGGVISPNTQTVNEGSNSTFTITADSGFTISDVFKNGASLGVVNSVSFTNVQADQTLSAVFDSVPDATTYDITVTAGQGGSITPGNMTLEEGQSASFSITPDIGYRILDVSVNGAAQGAVNTVAINNISADTTISATFEQIPVTTFTLTASAGSGGSVSPASTTVDEGEGASFTFTPQAGFEVDTVIVDGVSVGAVTSYSFTEVSADHQIAVSFKAVPTSGSGPCANYCANPVDATSGQSGNVGTGAVCHEIKRSLNGGNCYNMAGRTLSVNGVEQSCSGWQLPAQENGGYCVEITAGGVPWAGYSVW